MTLNASRPPLDLHFERPPALEATRPPEARGTGRGDVRLLVSSPDRHRHLHFDALPDVLRPGDVLVANDSATIAASLPAEGPAGTFRLNLCTRFGPRTYLAEPRRGHAEPGPLPLAPGARALVGGVPVRFLAPYPGLPRLWFVRCDAPLESVVAATGQPIRYAYVPDPLPLDAYQTVFARSPGSAEMPSAGRPFTHRMVRALAGRGVVLRTLTLHTGVSSLELDGAGLEHATLYPEPFTVPPATAHALTAARARGQRVIAVGTTVVRALETVWNGRGYRAASGFTRRFVRPGHGGASVDGLLTGLHDPGASHLALLYAVAGTALVREAYREAVAQGYLWHEFGDSHLLLPGGDGP